MTALASADSLDSAALEARVAKFLFREARLLDDARYDEWLTLWSSNALYAVPIDPGTLQSLRVAIVRDDRARLEERVFRLMNEAAHAQEPRSRVTHYLTNIEAEPAEEGTILVHAALLVVEVRRGHQEVYGGRVDYQLEDDTADLRIRSKTVRLTRSGDPLDNLVWIL